MLDIVPMSLKEANAFVERYHRHHGSVVGHKFSIGCSDGEKIVGVAIVGRPVARYLDDGWTLEVNRLCTDGTRNACSMLPLGGRPGLWAIKNWSLTYWRARTGQAYELLGGSAWDKLAVYAGRGSVARR